MDWYAWFQRWEQYMRSAVPYREERTTAVLDILALTMDESFLLLDLGCGPGSLSHRVLDRFPGAHCIAVDFDPLFLAMGQEVMGKYGERITWVDTNLLAGDWIAQLGATQVDVAASTSAFHNLQADQIVSLYQQLAEVVRPGGLFLNCDLLPFPAHLGGFRRLAENATQRNREFQMAQMDIKVQEGWYTALRQAEPELEGLFEERDRRHAHWQTPGRIDTSLELHQAALKQAGFQEVGVIWQQLNHYVIVAVR